MTFTGWLMAAAITLVAADVQADGPGKWVCTSEYQPATTPRVCYSGDGVDGGYDWRGTGNSVRLENGYYSSVEVAEFAYNPTAHTSTWIYHDTTVSPNGVLQWQSSQVAGTISVYVWCWYGLPRVNTTNGDGFCL